MPIADETAIVNPENANIFDSIRSCHARFSMHFLYGMQVNDTLLYNGTQYDGISQ
jgi:hypothetical protein